MHILYQTLMKCRPAFMVEIAKKAFRIKRQILLDKYQNKFWVDPVSHFGFELISTKEYEPVLTEFIRQVLGPEDVFVDVGANEGYFSILASKLVKTGKVLAFEPQNRLVSVLKKNIQLNFTENVILCPIALSDCQGEATLHLSLSVNTGSSSFYKSWRNPSKKQKVETDSLDSYLKKLDVNQVRLIKVDCEGGENKVVKGLVESLSRGLIDFLLVEYHEGIIGLDEVRKTHKLIIQTGYVLSRIESGLWVYHRPSMEIDLLKLGALNRVILDEGGNFVYQQKVPTQSN